MGILSIWMSEMSIWRANVINEIWLILNYSKVVWDIKPKFLPHKVVIRCQLFTKFKVHSCTQNGFSAKTILKLKWAWGAHFLSHTNQTWQICYFLGDVQIILLPLLGISNLLKVEKNAGFFISRFSELLAYAHHCTFITVYLLGVFYLYVSRVSVSLKYLAAAKLHKMLKTKQYFIKG